VDKDTCLSFGEQQKRITEITEERREHGAGATAKATQVLRLRAARFAQDDSEKLATAKAKATATTTAEANTGFCAPLRMTAKN
jgi:hypothetical protein